MNKTAEKTQQKKTEFCMSHFQGIGEKTAIVSKNCLLAKVPSVTIKEIPIL